jgi:hypothetical protein
MKKIIFLLLFVPVICRAQTCISGTNPKTGKPYKTGITTLKDPSPSGIGGIFIFTKIDDRQVLSFQQSFITKDTSYSTYGLILLTKLGNGNLKKLNVDNASKIFPFPDGIMVNLEIDLTDADIADFKQNPITLIKVCYLGAEDKGYNTEVTTAKSQEIIKSIACIQ